MVAPPTPPAESHANFCITNEVIGVGVFFGFILSLTISGLLAFYNIISWEHATWLAFILMFPLSIPGQIIAFMLS